MPESTEGAELSAGQGSSTTTLVLELPELRSHINNYHQRARTMAKSSLGYLNQCGQALRDAKIKAPHGTFGDWLAENCPDISERQAQRYMQIAAGWDVISEEIDRKGGDLLSVTGALALIQSRKPKPTGVSDLDQASTDGIRSVEFAALSTAYAAEAKAFTGTSLPRMIQLGKDIRDLAALATSSPTGRPTKYLTNLLTSQELMTKGLDSALEIMKEAIEESQGGIQ